MGMEHWAWEHPVEEAAVEEWDHRSGRLWVGWGVWSLQQGFGERMLWDRRWGMSSGAICRVRERQAGSIGVVWGGATNLESLCEQGTHTQTTPFLPLHSTFDFPLIRRLNLTKAPHHLAALWLTYSVPFTFAHCPAFLQGAWYLENKLLKYLRIQASGQRKQWHKLRPPPPHTHLVKAVTQAQQQSALFSPPISTSIVLKSTIIQAASSPAAGI